MNVWLNSLTGAKKRRRKSCGVTAPADRSAIRRCELDRRQRLFSSIRRQSRPDNKHGGNSIGRRQRDESIAPTSEQCIRADEQRGKCGAGFSTVMSRRGGG